MAANYTYQRTYSYEPEQYVPHELMNGGDAVTDLYGFDADGNRVDGLRLFDQLGRPLEVTTQDGLQTGTFPVSQWDPRPTYEGDSAWTPPMTLPSVPGATSTETSTSSSTSDPTSSSSSSSSSGSTTKGEKSQPSSKSPASPRSTATPSD